MKEWELSQVICSVWSDVIDSPSSAGRIESDSDRGPDSRPIDRVGRAFIIEAVQLESLHAERSAFSFRSSYALRVPDKTRSSFCPRSWFYAAPGQEPLRSNSNARRCIARACCGDFVFHLRACLLGSRAPLHLTVSPYAFWATSILLSAGKSLIKYTYLYYYLFNTFLASCTRLPIYKDIARAWRSLG